MAGKPQKNLGYSILLDFYGPVLTEKQRAILTEYYDEDLSLAEIAENFGITRQGVRDAVKRGEATLLALEEKVGFAARYRAMAGALERIESLARDIRFRNAESYSPSAAVGRDAEELIALCAGLSET